MHGDIWIKKTKNFSAFYHVFVKNISKLSLSYSGHLQRSTGLQHTNLLFESFYVSGDDQSNGPKAKKWSDFKQIHCKAIIFSTGQYAIYYKNTGLSVRSLLERFRAGNSMPNLISFSIKMLCFILSKAFCESGNSLVQYQFCHSPY